MLGLLLGGVVALAQRDARRVAVPLELVDERVVVLGDVFVAAERTEVRQFQTLARVDFAYKDVAERLDKILRIRENNGDPDIE